MKDIDDKVHSKHEQTKSSTRPVMRGTLGMVTSGHALATQAGMRILERGGNAIDAGVATGICLDVLITDIVGFAGVAPIIIYLANTKEVRTISGLGPWPKAASVDYFVNNFKGDIPLGIPRTVVPSAPDAWIQALRSYGTLSFEEVTRDAIYLAEEGFPMHQFMSDTLKEKMENYQKWPSSMEVSINPAMAMV